MEPRRNPSRDREAGLLYSQQSANQLLLVQVSGEGSRGPLEPKPRASPGDLGGASRALQGVARADRSQQTWASQRPDCCLRVATQAHSVTPGLGLSPYLLSSRLVPLPSVSLPLVPETDWSIPLFSGVYLQLWMEH